MYVDSDQEWPRVRNRVEKLVFVALHINKADRCALSNRDTVRDTYLLEFRVTDVSDARDRPSQTVYCSSSNDVGYDLVQP